MAPERSSRREYLAAIGTAVGSGCTARTLETAVEDFSDGGGDRGIDASEPDESPAIDHTILTVPLETPEGSVNYWDWLTLVCLQGIANRDGPRLYLDATTSDETWQHWYEDEYGVTFNRLEDPYEVFQAGDWPVEGLVVVDRSVMHTANVAATYAAVENLLPVTWELIERGVLPGWAIEEDLNERFVGWHRSDIYRWAVEVLWPSANHRIVANVLLPQSEVAVSTFRKGEQNVRDLVVAEGGFFFELSSDPAYEADYEVREQIMHEMDPGGYVLGWNTRGKLDDESQYVAHASEHGHVVVMTSQAANFSFHRFVGTEEPFDRPDASAVTDPDPDSVYVTFVVSDGDAVGALHSRYFGRWDADERGAVPLGWEMQPLMIDFAPGMLAYYYRNATDNDGFVASASGIGYTLPALLPEDYRREYLERSSEYMEEADLESLTVLTNEPSSRSLVESYAEVFGDELTGVMEGYYHDPGADVYSFDETVWLPTELPIWDAEERRPEQRNGAELADAIHRIAGERDRPLFVPVHVTIADQLDVAAVTDAVERLPSEEVTVLKPDEFFRTYLELHD